MDVVGTRGSDHQNMSKHDLFVVAGAGGFIGGHLVKKLREEGFEEIRAVDQKPISEWYQVFDDVENHALDLKGTGWLPHRDERCSVGL